MKCRTYSRSADADCVAVVFVGVYEGLASLLELLRWDQTCVAAAAHFLRLPPVGVVLVQNLSTNFAINSGSKFFTAEWSHLEDVTLFKFQADV